MSKEVKVKFVCKECGGSEVETQGWLEWIVDEQSWKFTDSFREDEDADWCNDCRCETRIIQKVDE